MTRRQAAKLSARIVRAIIAGYEPFIGRRRLREHLRAQDAWRKDYCTLPQYYDMGLHPLFETWIAVGFEALNRSPAQTEGPR